MTTIEAFRERYKYDQQKDHLGDGTFGNVFRAFDTHTQKWVAIKIVNLTNSENSKYNLAKESAIGQNIQDKRNIAVYIACYKVTTPTGFADIAVMELYEAGNLKHHLRNNHLTDIGREQLVMGLLNGLSCIHAHNIIHRDLKPENILIDLAGDAIIPKISDFGISKKSDNIDNSNFSNSLFGGTIAYSSPEQLREETNSLKVNTDIWSFGVIVYEIFLGTNPFVQGLDKLQDKDMKRREILKRIRIAEIPKEIASIKEPYQKIIKRCIVANPDKRIASTAQIKEMLRPFREDTERTLILEPKEVKKGKSIKLVFAMVAIVATLVGLYWGLGPSSGKSREQASLEAALVLQNLRASGRSDTAASVKPRSITDTILNYRFAFVPWGDSVKLEGGKDTLMNDFYIGTTEVTQAQWKKIMNTNPSLLSRCDSCPVDNVSLVDVQAFLKTLNERTGKNYRLPHINEWLRAYHGGKDSNYFKYSGSDTLSRVAWYYGNSKGKTHPVATRKANELGLYDMDGNVDEWSRSRWWDYDHYTKMYEVAGTSYWNRDDILYQVCNSIAKSRDKDGMGFRIVIN